MGRDWDISRSAVCCGRERPVDGGFSFVASLLDDVLLAVSDDAVSGMAQYKAGGRDTGLMTLRHGWTGQIEAIGRAAVGRSAKTTDQVQ